MADIASLRAAWRRGATPPPDLDVVGWAEEFRKLSKESSNGGRFRTAKVEVARGPMLWATEPGVGKLTLMACTQLLKTTVIENILGRFIHLDPCPILAVLPKDDAAETFSKDRFAPMVRDSRALRDLFGEAKSRDAGATLTHKQFPGGHITMVGANSPTNLSMRPIRLLVCDEIDKYPLSAGGEGPPIDLAEERQAEFKANSLTVLACSPTIAGRSAIEASYDGGGGSAVEASAYDAAGGRGRRSLAWRVGAWGPNAALTYALDELRRKSRDQTRKNQLAGAAVDRLVDNIVGTGIVPRSIAARSVVGRSPEEAKRIKAEDAAFRDHLQRTFLEWTDEADSVGAHDFYGLQAIAVTGMVEGGELDRVATLISAQAAESGVTESGEAQPDRGHGDRRSEEWARLTKPSTDWVA